MLEKCLHGLVCVSKRHTLMSDRTGSAHFSFSGWEQSHLSLLGCSSVVALKLKTLCFNVQVSTLNCCSKVLTCAYCSWLIRQLCKISIVLMPYFGITTLPFLLPTFFLYPVKPLERSPLIPDQLSPALMLGYLR